MPVISVTLIDGYNDDVRRALAERLTDAAVAAIGAPLDGITVVINEVPAANYMRGRISRTPGTPPPSASQIVQDYLAAMERRDLAAASRYLADNFTMTFPGGILFTRLEKLVAWAKGRYRKAVKSYEAVDEVPAPAGAIVYCFGTLYGEWLDGTPFEGIRFIDRFTVSNGLIDDQRVWNDMAEVRGPSTQDG